ncbi:hypothetical protein IDH50_11085 [Aeromicrobium tamlense]|uniref:Uncharacterized protein n=1 Tax=Aeromicrobium tamlense TaxID=375541 RepID=A0A8I0FZH6_9ACTN|nr:hypothetical protein [Aeromicrobium tamlense]MBD1270777.1 hypothetical protein [Aeromicrobium tamlense]NYI38169.1 hypothetical protein [Aeromicrobium tamlense]
MSRLTSVLLMLQLALDHDRRRDRGSVTTEHVLWAVAVIAIVAIAVAAIRAYVQSQAGQIN